MTHLMNKIFLTCSFLALWSCKNAVENGLIVRKENVVLRQSPMEGSPEVHMLGKGEQLIDLNATASNESVIQMGKETIQSPWLKIRTEEDKIGWVLAWEVKPITDQSDWLLGKRMDTYWGALLRDKRARYVSQFHQIKTQEDWYTAYHTGIHLRDTLMQLFQKLPNSGPSLNNRWMVELLPGFLYQEAAYAGQPYLFADYRLWLKKAHQTTGIQDDAGADLLTTIFPADSIESFFPVWVFQLDDQRFASQLGLGRHLSILQQIDKVQPSIPLADNVLRSIKQLIMEDILDRNSQYWQPAVKIREELATILSHPPKCLSPEELESIKIRLRTFEQPVKNGIKVDLRSGQ